MILKINSTKNYFKKNHPKIKLANIIIGEFYLK